MVHSSPPVTPTAAPVDVVRANRRARSRSASPVRTPEQRAPASPERPAIRSPTPPDAHPVAATPDRPPAVVDPQFAPILRANEIPAAEEEEEEDEVPWVAPNCRRRLLPLFEETDRRAGGQD